MCSRLSSKTTFAYVLKKWNTALCSLSCPFASKDQISRERAPCAVRYTWSQTSSVMTSINKHVLNLSVPYSDLYWLAESPCAELWFLKLTDFFIPVQVSWKCVYMIGKRRLLPLPELQLSLACGLKLQLSISVDRIYIKNQEVSCQFNKHENWPVVFTSWSFLPEVLSLKVYNHCLLHLKSNFLVFEYIFGRMSRGKIQAQRSCTSLLTSCFGLV